MLPSSGTVMELGMVKIQSMMILVQWNARKQRQQLKEKDKPPRNKNASKNERGKVISLSPVECHDAFECWIGVEAQQVAVSAEKCEGEKRHRRRKSNSNKKKNLFLDEHVVPLNQINHASKS